MTKSRIIALLIFVVLLVGCWNDVESYVLGRSLYYTFEANLQPETMKKLEDRYNVTLDEVSGVATVSSAQVVSLFNDMAMIIATDYENPYGLMGDLNELFRAAGAEYADDGSMLSLDRPITAETLRAFSRGWVNSKLDKPYA